MKFPNKRYSIVVESGNDAWLETYDTVEEAANSDGDTNRVAEYELVSIGKITTTRKFVAAK